MSLKNFAILLLFTIFIMPLSIVSANSEKPTVAVMPFSDQSVRSGVVQAEYMNNLREEVELEIVQTGKFRSLTRTEVDKLFNEINFDNSGLVDPATAAKFGKMIGARYLVLGTVTGLGAKKNNQYNAHVTLRMIEVETAEIYLAGRGEGKAKKDPFEALQKAVNDALNGQRGMLTMLRKN